MNKKFFWSICLTACILVFLLGIYVLSTCAHECGHWIAGKICYHCSGRIIVNLLGTSGLYVPDHPIYNPTLMMIVRFAGGALENVFLGIVLIFSYRFFPNKLKNIILAPILAFILVNILYMLKEGLNAGPAIFLAVGIPGGLILGWFLEFHLNLFSTAKKIFSFS